MANCFVIMPFRPELAYFYRFIQSHVQDVFPGVTVERGDDRTLTETVLEKIQGFLEQADFVIADCSGRNPNVFYELGMAHAMNKKVVLITSDDVETQPTDVRAFEFISYGKLTPEEFLAKLDQAIESIVGNPFEAMYDEAVELFGRFVAETGADPAPTSSPEFQVAMKTEHASGRPLPKQARKRQEYLVRHLLGPQPEIADLTALGEWLDAVHG